MTALRRSAPLLAPVVSSRAVGRTSPMPRCPRLARNRYGSTFQTTFAENSLPRRVAENEAKARLNTPRGRLGSTYFSCAGIGRFSHTPRSARTFFALRTFPSTLGAPYPAVSRFETLSAAEFDLSRVVSIPVLLVRRTGRAKVRSCRERFAPRRNPLTRSNRDALHDDHDPQHHRRSRLDSER